MKSNAIELENGHTFKSAHRISWSVKKGCVNLNWQNGATKQAAQCAQHISQWSAEVQSIQLHISVVSNTCLYALYGNVSRKQN